MNLSIKDFQEFSFCNHRWKISSQIGKVLLPFYCIPYTPLGTCPSKTKQSGNIVFSTVKCNALLFLLFVQISELDFLLRFLGLDFTHIKLKFFALKYVTITSSTLARSWRHTCCRRKNLKCLKTMKKEDHDNNVPLHLQTTFDFHCQGKGMCHHFSSQGTTQTTSYLVKFAFLWLLS